MKRFKFKINGNQYQADIVSIEDNIAEVDVNGTIYTVEAIHHGHLRCVCVLHLVHVHLVD